MARRPLLRIGGLLWVVGLVLPRCGISVPGWPAGTIGGMDAELEKRVLAAAAKLCEQHKRPSHDASEWLVLWWDVAEDLIEAKNALIASKVATPQQPTANSLQNSILVLPDID